jgi:uncharacterized membrane-anchored protein
MNNSMNRLIIVLGAALLLGSVNYSIYKKESIKHNGEVIFLELAPVDPRSLMQGDYMALRFALAIKLDERIPKRYGGRGDAANWVDGKFDTVRVALDARRVATLTEGDGLQFRYRVRNGQAWLGTNAFFFEEGTAERYNLARYGEFRLDTTTGEAVLVALRDAELRSL